MNRVFSILRPSFKSLVGRANPYAPILLIFAAGLAPNTALSSECIESLGGNRIAPTMLGGRATLTNTQALLCSAKNVNETSERLKRLGLRGHPLFDVEGVDALDTIVDEVCRRALGVDENGRAMDAESLMVVNPASSAVSERELFDFDMQVNEAWFECTSSQGQHFWIETDVRNPALLRLRVSNIVSRNMRGMFPRFSIDIDNVASVKCPSLVFGERYGIDKNFSQLREVCERTYDDITFTATFEREPKKTTVRVGHFATLLTEFATIEEETLAVCMSYRSAIDAIYESALQRAPSDAERSEAIRKNHLDQWSVRDELVQILVSQEGKRKLGWKSNPKTSITQLYQVVLGRRPVQLELDYYDDIYAEKEEYQRIVNSVVFGLEYRVRFGTWGVPNQQRATYVCP